MNRMLPFVMIVCIAGTGCATGLERHGDAVPDSSTIVEQVLSEYIGGIEDLEPGSSIVESPEAFETFRDQHDAIRFVDGRKETRTVPFPDLPDFDFEHNRLVLLWSGSIYRPVRVISATSHDILVAEEIQEYDEILARPMWVGQVIGLAVPRADEPPRIRWEQHRRENTDE